MAHRSIGQEQLGIASSARGGSPLDDLSAVLDWNPIAASLNTIHASAKGEPAWPPLAMFKARHRTGGLCDGAGWSEDEAVRFAMSA